MSAYDIDGDGRPELLAFNRIFKYQGTGIGAGKWSATKIGEPGGLIYAGRFNRQAQVSADCHRPRRRCGTGHVV